MDINVTISPWVVCMIQSLFAFFFSSRKHNIISFIRTIFLPTTPLGFRALIGLRVSLYLGMSIYSEVNPTVCIGVCSQIRMVRIAI